MNLDPAQVSVQRIVSELALKEHRLIQSDSFAPFGGEALEPFVATDSTLPKTLADLGEAVNRSYDMSITAAADAQIPVAGSASGRLSRRVIVLERAAFSKIPAPTPKDSEKHYGYAIRLCVTVSRWEVTTKVSLPFLAASAQLGTIDAEWILQVIGLAGAAIENATAPPTELNVETFVIAKQSLEKLVGAIRDSTTTFMPKLIAEIRPRDAVNDELRTSVGRSYALSCLERGRTLAEAQDRLDSLDAPMQDALVSIYAEVGNLTNPAEKPAAEVRRRAAELCGKLKTDTPGFW
jgi:hypothetical protein